MAPTLSAHSTNGMGQASVNIKQFEPPLDSVETAGLLRIHPKKNSQENGTSWRDPRGRR
jgi:hypothetical protein